MNMEAYEKAVELGLNRQHLFIATSDPYGWPHMASVGRFDVAPEGRVELSDWSCPLTERNLEHNRRVSLLIWDIATDVGYQLMGEVESVSASEDEEPVVGDPGRTIVVRVNRALAFSHAPHSDVESGEDESPGYLVGAEQPQVAFLGPAREYGMEQEAQG